MKNQTVSLSPPAVNIQLISNDNSYIVRGGSEEGYVNRSFLKDDPDTPAAVRELITSMYNYQRAQLDDFIATAPDDIEAQYSTLTTAMDDALGED